MKLSRFLLLAIALMGTTAACMAQEKAEAKVKQGDDFCTNWGNDDDRGHSYEVREYTVPNSGSVTVDGGTNGGVAIVGEERSDVFIRACVQAYAKTNEEAQALSKGINIQTGGVIRAEGPSDAQKGWSGNKGWGVSYRIHVPRSTNLKLTTHNGGIKISGVNGTMEFEALNGGIKLSDIAGNVRGRTTNGGIKVDLSGRSWSGGGLDVQTTNGGVKVSMPDNYAAQVETGTVNGGFKSEIAGIAPPDNGERKPGHRAVRINTSINGGGAPIRLVTVNGGVQILSSTNKD